MRHDLRASHHSCLTLLAVMTAAACSGHADGKDVTEPPEPLAVVSTVPAAGEQQADPFVPVSVTFGEALDPTTVTPAALTLSAGGSTLASTPTYDGATRTVRTAAPLVPGMAYEGTVAATVRSSTGGQLEQAYSWTFTTRPWHVDGIGSKAGYLQMAFSRDASGTLHRLAPATDGANVTLYYGVCPGACETPGSWQQVPLFTSGVVHGHSILIDGSGRIHILFQDGGSAALYYGTCSSACQTVGGWQLTPIILSDHGSDGYDAAPIVQESDGSLLVTTTSYTGGGYGLMLGGCVSDCANATNWEYAALAPDGRYPALAIDASGRHHLLFRRQADSQLVYGSCSSACLAPASWQLLPIGPSSTSTQIALLTTASGVHALLNAGHQITYFACASSCESASAWTAAVIDDVAGGDRAVALAQSGDIRLHAFYSDHTANELKYASCTTDCASGTGWVSGVIATGMDVRNTSVVIDAAGAPIAVSDDYGTNRLVIVR